MPTHTPRYQIDQQVYYEWPEGTYKLGIVKGIHIYETHINYGIDNLHMPASEEALFPTLDALENATNKQPSNS